MKYLGIIILCLLILFMLYINSAIIEGNINLPSGSNKASIKDIDDMRNFLEQMYMITILNPNDKTNNILNTNSYKISILGTYLWPLLGPYTEWSLDNLAPIFGSPTKPTSQMAAMAEQAKQEPPKIPILSNDKDYGMFLQLAVLGNMIMPFSVYPANNGNSVTLWYKEGKDTIVDRYNLIRDLDWGHSIFFSNMYLTEITLILAYFHAQMNSTAQTYPSDNVYTKYTHTGPIQEEYYNSQTDAGSSVSTTTPTTTKKDEEKIRDKEKEKEKDQKRKNDENIKKKENELNDMKKQLDTVEGFTTHSGWFLY